MKSILQKTIIALLLMLCVGKGYGQIIEENRHYLQIHVGYDGGSEFFCPNGGGCSSFNSIPFSFLGNPLGQFHILETNGAHEYHISNWPNTVEDHIKSYIFDDEIIVSVSGPLCIKEITFGDDKNCACPNQDITLIFPDKPSTAPEYPSAATEGYYYPDADIECKNKNGAWVKIGTASASFSRREYRESFSYFSFLYKPGLNPHEEMFFRTVRALPDGSYSTSTYNTKGFFYFPGFQFPAGKSLKVKNPVCLGDSTIIKIPYSGETDYSITVKTPGGSGWGGNPSLLGCSSEIIDGVTYYLLTVKLVPGKYVVDVENKLTSGTPCIYTTPEFTVSEIPAFTISQPTYTSYTDNSGQQIQIRKRGETAQVSFTITGSKNQSVTIHAGGSNNFVKQLTSSYLVNDSTYYTGTVNIDLLKGEYTDVYVDNVSGCSATFLGTFKLKEPASIAFTSEPADPKCFGTKGSIRLSTISGGIGSYTYCLDNGEQKTFNTSTVDIDGIDSGNHTITITDSSGNLLEESFTIGNAPSKITITTTVTPPSISGGSDGTITISAQGGTSPYTYSKSMNSGYGSQNTLTGFSKGEYTIYVEDINRCKDSVKVTISEGRQITVKSIDAVAPSCKDDTDGSCRLIIGSLEGALSVSELPFYSTINISKDTITITGLPTGNYSCKITETLQSETNTIDYSFSIPAKQPITVGTTVTPVFNKGAATGKIEINVSGGNGGEYDVVLFDEQNNKLSEKKTVSGSCIFENLTGAHADNGKLYKIKAVDSKNCFLEISVRILESETALRLNAVLTTPVSCPGNSNAAINISAEGGWGDYLYSTDNAAWNTTTVFTGLSAGTYSFYAKDKSGGTASTTITVVDPQPLEIAVQSIASAACFGSATGSIRFRVSGGTPPYSLTPALGTADVDTENGNTYMIVSELPAGNYTFTLKDSRNCTLQAAQATVNQPAKLTVSTSNLVHPTCGWENGAVTVSASGGITPYTYTLKAAATNAVVQTKTSSIAVQFENVAGGSYYVAVTDNNGCSEQSASVVLDLYTGPAITGVIINDVSCFGESNGKITANAQKGTSDIDYFTLTNTSDNTTIQNNTGIFENLTAGDYVLSVFDDKGCRSQNAYPAAVKQPDVLRMEVDKIVSVINKGTNDGKIQFRVIGGNTGSILVYLKDAENVKIDSVSIIRGFTGELFAAAGVYTLEAVDNKGCSFITESFRIEEPADNLRLIIREVKDALCKSQTGRIVVEGQGGWGDYRYKRAIDGQYTTLNRFENLYPGAYVITVTDKAGATASQSVTIYEPQDSLKAETIDIQVPTCADNGALFVELSGGTPPYKLFSENGNDTIFADMPKTVVFPNIASGGLLLHLTDANGCKFELETFVSDTALLQIGNFEVIPPGFPQAANGAIIAKTFGGTNPLTYTWRKIGHAASFPDNRQISNLSSGYYELKITDGAGCSVTGSVYLPDPNDGIIIVAETGDETFFNAADGYAILYSDLNLTNVRVINPENNYIDYSATTHNADFRLSNDSIYLNHLTGGNRIAIGTNASGQNAFAEFEIKPYVAFMFGKTTVIPVSIPDGSDGSISIEIQGGVGEYLFVWTDEQGNILPSDNAGHNSRLTDLPAGKYTLTVTDKYGNTISTETEVPSPDQALQLIVSEQKDQSCNGMVNAYTILSAVGGWGDYRYAHYRQPAAGNLAYGNAEVYADLETGEHYFYVVDKYGKTAEVKTIVTEPDILRASVTGTDHVKCKDDVNGQITFNISGGNPPYYFKRSDATVWEKGNIAFNLPAGEYTFEFTDSLRCTSPDTLTVIVTEPDSLLFQSIDVRHTTCSEDNGQIQVSLKGGTRPYVYQWKDAENNVIGTDSIITDLKQSALYRLYVTDKNGCTQYMEQVIQPSKPPRIISVETTDVLCYGDSSGTARIKAVEPGEPDSPYSFTWSNGTSGDFTGNLPTGRHFVTVYDDNDCATDYYFNIAQPDSLYLLITDYLEPHCFGYSDGYIHTQTFGGAGDYTYLWSNNATTPDIDNITTGDYRVRVTDKNGCVFEQQFMLNEPPYQQIDLGEDLMMCPGNTHVIDGGNYVSYRWFTDTGDISDERYLSVTKEDRYYLEAKMPDGCSAWGDIGISIGNNALKADMLLASEAAVGDTLVIFEISNLPLDSLKWTYDTTAFERITIDSDFYNLPYVLLLRCLQTGIYNIGLAAYSGGCYAPVVKQIEIAEARDDDDDDWWGAKELLILSLEQYPNPTDGNFTVELELRKPDEARFVIFEVASGICVDQRSVQGNKYYKIDYRLNNLQTGVYVLIVTAGNERRQMKIIIE